MSQNLPSREPSNALPASRSSVRMAAYVLIVAAAGWFLLGELQALFRPLLFAILAAYVLMPIYQRLRRRLPAALAVTTLTVSVTAGFAMLVTSLTLSLLTLTQDEQNWRGRALARVREVSDWAHQLPFVEPVKPGQTPAEELLVARLTDELSLRLRSFVVGLPEVFASGLYLLFLLLESAKFPNRVRRAYDPQQAGEILVVFHQINEAIMAYLRAKVVSSLWLAVPVGVALVAFGVPFALVWVVLTFVCNFIPYLGSVVAYCLPVMFAAVEFGFTEKFIAVSGVIFAIHLFGAAVLEPLLLGKAVGLSPLVILASLTVWGLLWSIPGMFLAVPLTVVLKIVFDHIPATRSASRMLTGD